MRKVLFIAAMIVATLTASAQNVAGGFSIKPMAGVSFATITNDKDAKMKVGFVGGAEAEYGISNRFGIAAGVVFSMQGAKAKTDYGILDDKVDLKYNMNYLNIPILAKFYINGSHLGNCKCSARRSLQPWCNKGLQGSVCRV